MPNINIKEYQSSSDIGNTKDKVERGRENGDIVETIMGVKFVPENYRAIAEQMIEDQSIVRQKYGLPPMEMLINNPLEYMVQLKRIANENEIRIRRGCEFQDFFTTNTDAAAVLMDEFEETIVLPEEDYKDEVYNRFMEYIGFMEKKLFDNGADRLAKKYPDLNIESLKAEVEALNESEKRKDREYITALEKLYAKRGIPVRELFDIRNIAKYCHSFEHELIHGLQKIRYRSMPIELGEYEAYIAGCNTSMLRSFLEAGNEEKVGHFIEIIFLFYIRGSVNFWYQEKGLANPYHKQTEKEEVVE